MTITVDQQDVWPPRVLVSVTALTPGDSVEVYRQVSTDRTLVRAGSNESVSDTAFLVIDAELPFGVPVSYVAVVNGVEQATSATTYELPGGKVAMSDAITGLAAEVEILEWPEKSYERQSSLFKVGNRNIVVSGDVGQFEGEITIATRELTAFRKLEELIRGATEGIVQIRQSGGYDEVDCYVAIMSFKVRRPFDDMTDPKRLTILTVAESDGWPEGIQARGYTYNDLEEVYTGLTYDDLANDYATYLDLARAELM